MKDFEVVDDQILVDDSATTGKQDLAKDDNNLFSEWRKVADKGTFAPPDQFMIWW